MSSLKGKKREIKKWAISPGSFVSFTLAALILGAALISLGRISSAPVSIALISPSPPTTNESPVPAVVISGTTKGSPSAPVTVIEYSDFQCAHCQQFALTIEPLFEAAYIYTGKVRLIYKYMIAYGDESLLANEAAESAAEQNQFWPYYYLLMQQRASAKEEDLPIEKLESLAQQLNLDTDAFNMSLESGKYEAKVKQDDEEGRALGITGTPTFFINGVRLNGATSLKDFQDIIDPMLQKENK